MILLTGAYGFIGSMAVENLLRSSDHHILAVDDFTTNKKKGNLPENDRITKVERADLWAHLAEFQPDIEWCIHLGARTDTTENNETIFNILNVDYSKQIWNYCADHHIPLIYASSAATYGDGSLGFSDNHAVIPRLSPLNAYGWSKQEFDLWTLAQKRRPPAWYGLKFFNVYGPNEYHKGRMASVVFHAFHQILKSGQMKLFRSHRKDIEDGHQSRDFIYVEDVVAVIRWLMIAGPKSGIYNLGTGSARSFLDLTRAVFSALAIPENISFIDTPFDIRENYQYFTEARMEKLRVQGCPVEFTSLEKGITHYIQEFLLSRYAR